MARRTLKPQRTYRYKTYFVGLRDLRGFARSVQRRDAPAQHLHVLPDLLVLLALVLVQRLGRRQLQVGLQIAQRGRKVLEVIREKAAIAQLMSSRRIDGEDAAR